MPLVRIEAGRRLLQPPSRPGPGRGVADRLPGRRVRLHGRPSAADPHGRRADLQPPARLPDRHRRQVRRHALEGRGRQALRPGQELRPGYRLLRRLRRPPGGRPRPSVPDPARAGHPGRAAPDLRPAGHGHRPLRDGHRPPLPGPAGARTQDRLLDGHGPPGPGADPGPLRPDLGADLPAARPEPPRLVLRQDRHDPGVGPVVPGHRRPGPQRQAGPAQDLPGLDVGGRDALPGQRRQARSPTIPPTPT